MRAQVAHAGTPAARAVDAELDRLLDESQRAFEAFDATRGLSLLQEIHARAIKGGLTRYEAEALRRLAIGDVYAGRRPAAIDKLTRSRGLFAETGDRAGEARVCVMLARQLRATVPDTALALARHAWDVARSQDDAVGMLDVAGFLAYVIGEGPEKDELRAESFAAAKRVPGQVGECAVLHEWADQLFARGSLAPAYDVLTRTIACWERTPNRAAEGRVYVSMGRLYRAHGRLSEALEWHRRAFALQEKYPDPSDPAAVIQSLNAIAVTLQHMGRASEALSWFEKGLERAEAAGQPQIVSFLRGNVAGAYLALGRNEEAAALLKDAIAVEKTPALLALRQSQMSFALLHLGRLDEALEHANRAVDGAASFGFDVILAARENRASVLVGLKRFADAEADLRALVDRVEQLRAESMPGDVMKRGFHDWHQRVFAGYVDLLGQQGKARESLEMAERARARAFLDLLATRTADPARAEPAGVDQLQRAARRLGSTILSYWVGTDTLSIWVVPPTGAVTLTRVPVHAARVAELVQQASGLPGEGGAPETRGLLVTSRALRAPWRELERLLVAPVARQLPAAPGARLTIVPHGALFGLSFAGLPDARGQYLVERFDVHYVPAGAVLARAPAPKAVRRSALVVGDPGAIAVGPGEEPLPALPWARTEAGAAQRLLGPETTVLLGDEATESRIRESVAGRSVLHFATHGIVHNEERLASYLALRPSGDTDGRLTADEVYGLALDSDLVVLSGCRTALGPVGGDGVIGFTRAFLTAGARSVVATQWDVSDRVSYEVMRQFYRRRRDGTATSRALRGAQLAVLAALRQGTLAQDGQPLPETPRLWAGFVLVGEP